jgi:hypothetical protein
MTVTLHLEINGKLRRKIECEYEKRFITAERLARIYPGKKVVVYYTLQSKINYINGSETI